MQSAKNRTARIMSKDGGFEYPLWRALGIAKKCEAFGLPTRASPVRYDILGLTGLKLEEGERA